MSATKESVGLGPLAGLLRCVTCGAALATGPLAAGARGRPDGALRCEGCGRTYPVSDGTVRAVAEALPDVKRSTAESFSYEWERFGELRPEWRENFVGYMQPHDPRSLAGKLVLDAGAGSGRHSHQAAELGARVVAVDIGMAIDVARRNLPTDALTVQADLEELPFEEGAFDFVMSIGVLHHLSDTEAALRSLVRYVRPGGHLQIYLYWTGERGWHRAVLGAVRALRRLTVKLPHRLLHVLCYPLAALLHVTVVAPHRVLRRRRPWARRVADALPLQTYADYPFEVLVNDQFDRLSAPIERRLTRGQVEELLRSAGLEDVRVLGHHGWVGSGRRPAAA